MIETHRHSEKDPWTYQRLDLLQGEIRDGVLEGKPGRILFSEVAPVITLGRRRTEEDLLADPEEYAKRGIQLMDVSRGGRATYHGPGQWVVFVVGSLETMTGDRRGVRKLVDGLFQAILEVCRMRFPAAEIREGKEAGIWTKSGGQASKVAALGVQIDRGVVLHGFSVNIFKTETSFYGLNPCGLQAPVGYLEPADLPVEMREQAFLDWRERIEISLRKQFPRY